MLVHDVSHEARDACESSARSLAAATVPVTDGADTTGQPLETARQRCVRAQNDHCSQTESAERWPATNASAGGVGLPWYDGAERKESGDGGCNVM